jgi:hypothetical protein
MKLTRTTGSLPRIGIVVSSALTLALAANVSAHVIRGLQSPALATAFVSSPASGTDAPIPIRWATADVGLRVVCFNIANTSPNRVDRPGWPRITGAGFELPDARSGFSLLEPLDSGWELVEDIRVPLAGHGVVTLDFAIVARRSRAPGMRERRRSPRGIPPGQTAVRGSGTRFCVSGPFPDELSPGQATNIEQFINGVVVEFRGVEGNGGRTELGVWDNAARVIPLFPDESPATR